MRHAALGLTTVTSRKFMLLEAENLDNLGQLSRTLRACRHEPGSPYGTCIYCGRHGRASFGRTATMHDIYTQASASGRAGDGEADDLGIH